MSLEVDCKPVPSGLIAHISMASPADTACCERADAFQPTTLPKTLSNGEKVVISITYSQADGRFHSSATSIFEGLAEGEKGYVDGHLADTLEVTGQPNHAGFIVTGK
ncbi:MAG: hypothetical protein UU25_C0026G0014 [Microgenomates group bacterium GW2011_GWB1_40_9]|nr:MAG: hypothetical protein UT26_C0034G0021 [Microgenomates group bacterium GW2011_GWC1_39_12]KKR78973.1 MAG: hypothetical protein UU25_C0026G0014 [Microgenomates group bacterium GW2011_GWB1_40_9]